MKGGAAQRSLRLNHKVVLETSGAIPDNAGGSSVTWLPVGTLWAKGKPGAGRLSTGEAGAVSTTDFDVWVRAAPIGQWARPVPGQRFTMAGRRLLIESVTEQEPHGLYLRCLCKEEVYV